MDVRARVRVPGKMMLVGEYAVLAGGKSLSITVPRFLTAEVRVDASRNGQIHLRSDIWEREQVIAIHEKSSQVEPMLVHSVRAAWHRLRLKDDLTIAVSSELRVSDGLGSSSAVRLATTLAMAALAAHQRGTVLPQAEVWQQAEALRAEQCAEQGFASGYDLATQLVGGGVLFQHDPSADGKAQARWPQYVERLPREQMQALQGRLHAFVGGAGAPTASVGGATLRWLRDEHLLGKLHEISEQAVASLLAALAEGGEKTWSAALQDIAALRVLFQAGPVYPHALHKALSQVEGFDRSWTYKTTGAGGEDALVMFGDAAAVAAPARLLAGLGWQKMPECITPQGATMQAPGFEGACTCLA